MLVPLLTEVSFGDNSQTTHIESWHDLLAVLLRGALNIKIQSEPVAEDASATKCIRSSHNLQRPTSLDFQRSATLPAHLTFTIAC
ncbi:hypothetical protein BOTNAR_0300g00090 [Botryotinia narcissicola]|uniref:Uncharacterized protein n=1 Tax=Botryotinia narcissicola TaxID=278944 RepID=A0A4Z1I1C3_9HELO|nr:hypothetical protein BOTNAR_0300g00090 [Botryotinia narcissicola]